MSWTYTGDPADSDKDEVRFLVGDTCAAKPLVSDEEVLWAISDQSTLRLAAAVILRALAAKFSREATRKVGDVSRNCSDIAKAFKDRADELDPGGVTTTAPLALPSFGGLTYSEKESLAEDSDAVQPRFERGMNDIPGGYPDGETYDDTDWTR